jgi:hypothetical protein
LGKELATGAGQARGATVEHVDRAGVHDASDILKERPDGQIGEAVIVEVGPQTVCDPVPCCRGVGGDLAGTHWHANRENNDDGDY